LQPGKSILKRNKTEPRKLRNTTLADTITNTSRNRLMELSDASVPERFASLSINARYGRRAPLPQWPIRRSSLGTGLATNYTKFARVPYGSRSLPGPTTAARTQSETDNIPDPNAASSEITKTVRFARVDIHTFMTLDGQDSESDDDGGGNLEEVDTMSPRSSEPIAVAE
jgi:hypothetical protein